MGRRSTIGRKTTLIRDYAVHRWFVGWACQTHPTPFLYNDEWEYLFRTAGEILGFSQLLEP